MSDSPLTPPRRALRLLHRLGLRGRLVIERLDGTPISDADLDAVRRAVAEIDEVEARAERSLGGSNRRPTHYS